MNELNRLQQLCPSPDPSPSPIEWTAVENALGTQLPSDYKNSSNAMEAAASRTSSASSNPTLPTKLSTS